MNKNRLSSKNRAYFEFIDELKKSSRADSPTAEISRMYMEISDILTEAFDEFNPEDLPKYQDRLEGIISLQQQEPSLSDPLFKEDLTNAKSLLGQMVTQRFGTVQKLSKIARATLQTFGNVSSHVRDFISVGEQAADAGRRVNQITFGSRNEKLSSEEERRQYDVFKGNDVQYSQTQPVTSTPGLNTVGKSKQILPVKDDTLIGSNNQQNRVLIQLFNVTKDSNSDIKQIKNLLISDTKQKDDEQDDLSLDLLENKQETQASTKKTKDGLFEAVVGAAGGYVAGSGKQGESPTSTPQSSGSRNGEAANTSTDSSVAGTVVQTLAIEKALEWLWKKRRVAWEGAKTLGRGVAKYGSRAMAATPEIMTGMAASPAALAMTGGAVGYLAADALITPHAKAISQGVQSLAATIGSKIKGVDYYKDVMKDPSLAQDLESQERTEQWTLELLEGTAREKRERFQKAFRDGSRYGDGSYQKNKTPLSIDEASSDVQAAEEQVKSYKDYLDARKKSGKSLGPLAKFSVDGKEYQNPLFSAEEYGNLSEAQINPDILSSRSIHQRLGRQLSHSMNFEEGSDKNPFGGQIKAINPDELEQMMRMIAAAETGPLTGESSTSDLERAIRTKGGANSSAYGPYQITYSLAEGALKNGLFKNDSELQGWVQDRFVPQGKKMINSSYSDPKYGAGGSGDLNNPQDMAMYEKMARALIADNMARNKGNTLQVLGEHRFGERKKHSIMSADPDYARKALHQLKRDRNRMVANIPADLEVEPAVQSSAQVALNELSREYDASKSAPIIVQMPTPTPTPQPVPTQSGVSTKTVGASPNAASDSSLMLGIRHSISPL